MVHNKVKRCSLRIAAFVLCLMCIFLSLVSCSGDKIIKYYSNKNNFVQVTGVVTYIAYTDKESSIKENAVYIGLEEAPEGFSDTCFKIIGKNYDIVIQNGIKELLQYGTEVTIISAPEYWGDGYVMPIAAIIIGDTVLLDFETGHAYLMEWLEDYY